MLRVRALAICLAAACFACAATVRAADDADQAVREAFRQAYAAAAVPPSADQAEDSASLRTYVLYPYLLEARLERDLRLQSDPDVDTHAAAFIQRYGDMPVTHKLRHAWLADLAHRKAWGLFLAQYQEFPGDVALRCDALQARIVAGQSEGLPAAIAAEWLSGKDLPDECDPDFDWLRAHQLLTPALIEQRAHLALTAGNAALARRLAIALPPGEAQPIVQWSALIEQPQREIDSLIANPIRSVDSAALQDGWLRLSRNDPDAAIQRFAALLSARNFDSVLGSPYARSLAFGLALSRRPEALDYFARVSPGDFDDRSAEWYVRAALWAGNWPRVAQAIAGLPPAVHETPRWRYWAARIMELQGNPAGAKPAYEALAAGADNYHGALAALRLGRPFSPHAKPMTLDPQAASRIGTGAAFVRARELLACDLEPLAAVEWQSGFEPLPAADKLQAVGLALSWGWPNQAIAIAARQGVFDDYARLYPFLYDAAVHAGATQAQLPDDLLYALLRQESLYDAHASSRAGALGLLQLLPETARRTARRLQQAAPAREDLFDPAVNVPLGAAYLRSLLDLFGGQLPVAIAAYNAGANAATRWLPEQPRAADVWIENIPYNETREYVQRVYWHRLVFDWRRSGQSQPLADWPPQISMPQVPSPAGDAEPQ